jgi:hypothetical protein
MYYMKVKGYFGVVGQEVGNDLRQRRIYLVEISCQFVI